MFPRGFRWAGKNTEKFWWEQRRTSGPKVGILSVRLDRSELGSLPGAEGAGEQEYRSLEPKKKPSLRLLT